MNISAINNYNYSTPMIQRKQNFKGYSAYYRETAKEIKTKDAYKEYVLSLQNNFFEREKADTEIERLFNLVQEKSAVKFMAARTEKMGKINLNRDKLNSYLKQINEEINAQKEIISFGYGKDKWGQISVYSDDIANRYEQELDKKLLEMEEGGRDGR